MFAFVAVVFNSFIFVHGAHKSHTVNCDDFQDFGSNCEHREESHHDCHPRRYIAFCFMHRGDVRTPRLVKEVFV